MSHVTQQDGTSPEPDLLSEVGSELQVTLDRWSAGHIGLSDLVVAGAIAAAAALLAWVARRMIRRVTRNWEGPAEAAGVIIGQLLSVAVYLFATGLVLEILGFGLGPVIILLLIVVLIVLFLRPVVRNLSSGLLLQLGGTFAHGDLIETNGLLGVVEQFGTRTVVLVTNDGQTVHIPNHEVLGKPLVNYSSVGRRRSELTLRLPQGADVTALVERLADDLASLSDVLDDPAPEVVRAGFDGDQPLLRVLFWHGPELRDERGARDGVAGVVARLVDRREFSLTSTSIVIHHDD